MFRITRHPILTIEKRKEISYTFNGEAMKAYEGEVITTALFANGIRVFGHHPRDGGSQGIFCVNGQCSQCMLLVDGVPVKGCMTVLKPGMRIESCEGVPALPTEESVQRFKKIPTLDMEALVIGGGPAGINAAVELGRLGVKTLLVDDKSELGGKLTLQTHPFFGSRDDCYAGTRGIEIARILTGELGRLDSVSVMLETTAVGVFYDRKLGLCRRGDYYLADPRVVLVACGAREKTLLFPGCDLPGVYGAGAFQTLLNRDLIRPAERLFIVGGGNVGLITGYHAIQAGIKVVGLAEALPRCGGYKVHLDKLRRLGVPVFTSHTVIGAEGTEELERITIAKVDESFQPVKGTERSYEIDTLLIAVGLSPVNELYEKLKGFGIECFAAGDSEEISEASAAIFSGKITGRRIARALGYDVDIPQEWETMAEVLRSKPGRTVPYERAKREDKVFPLIFCVQEIPCNPCVDACPRRSIKIPGDPIMGLPVFEGSCTACAKCVDACPALAINMIHPGYNREKGLSLIVLPYELDDRDLIEGRPVETVGMEGEPVGEGRIVAFRRSPIDDKRMLVSIEVPRDEAFEVAGFAVLEAEYGNSGTGIDKLIPDDTIVCRCERVTA
ncbi:MAG: FAD-dependent oxidoreductase, partial [Candidatus Krumholzibacteria bacterium]|nr:FAD-dependent oxidoreductase [Candidatus Krumholzibacteria bacterium]